MKPMSKRHVIKGTSVKEGSTTYAALCAREGRWWVVTVPELPSGGVTQARSLDQVPAVVADLVAAMTGVDRAAVEVDMRVHAGPELGKRRRLRLLLVAD